MKKIINGSIWSALAVSLFLTSAQSLLAAAPGNLQQPQEANTQPVNAPQDPIAQLNLSPEQRQQIRAIREENKEERAQINRRLRETQLALDQALDSDSPDEALIEQRARDAGAAQAASIRLRALTETRIRRVLTPEQVKTLRELRLQVQMQRREQRIENRADNVPGRNMNGRQRLPGQRNGVFPGNRRETILKRPRP